MENEDVTLGNGEHKISIPGWLIGAILTLALALFANVGTSAYWAGTVTAQQQATSIQLNQLRDEVQKLRELIDEMNKRSNTKD